MTFRVFRGPLGASEKPDVAPWERYFEKQRVMKCEAIINCIGSHWRGSFYERALFSNAKRDCKFLRPRIDGARFPVNMHGSGAHKVRALERERGREKDAAATNRARRTRHSHSPNSFRPFIGTDSRERFPASAERAPMKRPS